METQEYLKAVEEKWESIQRPGATWQVWSCKQFGNAGALGELGEVAAGEAREVGEG